MVVKFMTEIFCFKYMLDPSFKEEFKYFQEA